MPQWTRTSGLSTDDQDYVIHVMTARSRYLSLLDLGPLQGTARRLAEVARERPVVDGQYVRGRLVQQSITKYDRTMAVERLTVSLESELAIAVREAADADEQNVSAWLADAARRQLANRGLRDIVAAWEHEHGAFSGDELAAARALVDG